ncbi:hypothetical protein [Streptomyces sp. NPDC003952]
MSRPLSARCTPCAPQLPRTPWPESFAGTSQLVHLVGWMAQDEGGTPELRGLAQRRYAHSFRLRWPRSSKKVGDDR